MRTQESYKLPERLMRAVDEADKILAGGDCDLVLDFCGCRFISVEGLEWLEELLLRAPSLKAEVTFVNVDPVIYKVFKVARIDNVLKACGGQRVQGPVC